MLKRPKMFDNLNDIYFYFQDFKSTKVEEVLQRLNSISAAAKTTLYFYCRSYGILDNTCIDSKTHP